MFTFTFTFNLHLTLSGVGFANRAEPTRTRSSKMMQANGTPYSSKTPVLSQMRWGCKNKVIAINTIDKIN